MKKEYEIINIMSKSSEHGMYSLAHNRFSTMTDEEFKKMLGKKPDMKTENKPVRMGDKM